MKAKYIVFEADTGTRRIIVFPDSVVHAVMADCLRSLGKPISAGFLRVGADCDGATWAQCHGESVSLNLKAHPSDTALALQLLDLDEGR